MVLGAGKPPFRQACGGSYGGGENLLCMELRPPRGVLSKDEMRTWARPNKWRLLLDLVLIWGQGFAGAALFLYYPHWTTLCLGWFLIGGAQHACALVAHEGAHFLLLPHDRPNNDRISRWLFASAICLPFSVYRARHFIHHRQVSTDDDTKDLYRRQFKGAGMLWQAIRSLTGFEFISTAIAVLIGLGKSNDKATQKSNPRLDSKAIVLVQAALMGAFGDIRLYLLLWIVPLFTVTQLFSKMRAAVEHCPLASESYQVENGPYFKGTEKPLLRSVEATAFENLFLTRLNFHFHAEHHLYPQISYQYLPTIHHRLGQRDDHDVVFERSYLAVLGKLWRGL